MNRARVLILLGITFLILILGAGAGAWWYLFGPNQVESADLVPGDTIFFASIPNAANIVAGYQTSQLRQLVDSPNSQPVSDTVTKWAGQKNIDVLNAFLPNLSGQSFFAITHFDSAHPEQVGVIAAMKPKAGTNSFNAFVDKLKATWPDVIKQGTNGTGNVEGVDYQWLKGPGGADKLCVAQLSGWIITSWGEAPLQDWIQRFHKKSITPSLAQNTDYQKSIAQVGKDPMTLIYLDYHAVLNLAEEQLAKTAPAQSSMLMKKLGAVGGIAMGSRFENGEIVDRFSFQIPKQAQADAGLASTPCPFDTLKFTSQNTRLYWASSIDWKQYWKNLEEATAAPAPNDRIGSGIVSFLTTFAQSNGLDLHRNIIDALGSEVSLQMEWNDDSTYPELGLFLKIEKPDDFKPTITALIESARKTYSQQAVINEISSNGQNFAALKFIQSSPVTVTITETGPYFGIFTAENIAARSFAREEVTNLPHTDNFTKQIGDKRNGASQLAFMDTPHLLDRTYRTALPYVSLLSMFNKDMAAFLQGKSLPPDLTWLAPMDTWSYVMTPNDQSVQGYSISGIGNQGIFLAMTGSSAFFMAESMGMIPRVPAGAPVQAGTPPPQPPAPAPATPPAGSSAPAPGASSSTAPASPTNTPPPASDTSPPAATPSSPNTPPPPATNAPATPDAPKPQ